VSYSSNSKKESGRAKEGEGRVERKRRAWEAELSAE